MTAAGGRPWIKVCDGADNAVDGSWCQCGVCTRLRKDSGTVGNKHRERPTRKVATAPASLSVPLSRLCCLPNKDSSRDLNTEAPHSMFSVEQNYNAFLFEVFGLRTEARQPVGRAPLGEVTALTQRHPLAHDSGGHPSCTDGSAPWAPRGKGKTLHLARPQYARVCSVF